MDLKTYPDCYDAENKTRLRSGTWRRFGIARRRPSSVPCYCNTCSLWKIHRTNDPLAVGVMSTDYITLVLLFLFYDVVKYCIRKVWHEVSGIMERTSC